MEYGEVVGPRDVLEGAEADSLVARAADSGTALAMIAMDTETGEVYLRSGRFDTAEEVVAVVLSGVRAMILADPTDHR